MSRKSMLCLSCGSETEKENGYLVCVSCGVVAENGVQFADDPMQTFRSNDSQLFSSQSVHKTMRNELSSALVTPVRRMGIKVAETLAVNFNFRAEMKDYLMTQYMKALNHELFFNCTLKSKEMLAAVCAYVTMINYDEPIAMLYICNAVGCDGYEFGQIYTQFLTAFPECKLRSKPIEELVPLILTDYAIDKDETIKLNARIIDIISVEKACWLVDGRSPIHLINAATYLAWKSLKPCDRAKVKLRRFCQMVGVQYNQTTLDRVKELNAAFIQLARYIPIVKHCSILINKNNIAVYINDIIQYSNSLIYDLQRDLNKRQPNHHLVDGDSNEDSVKLMNSFKRKIYYGKQININERQAVDNEENQDPYLSDSEINSYLRSEQEIKLIKKLRKKAKRMSDI